MRDYEKLQSDINEIGTAIQCISAAKSIQTDGFIEDVAVSQTSKTIQNYLESDLNSADETTAKKIFACAAAIAKDRGLLQEFPDEALCAAAAIDDSLTRVKTAYQVAQGIIDVPETAAGHLVDIAQSRVIVAVDTAFNSGAVNTVVTDGIVTLSYMIPYIGPTIGPVLETCRPLISAIVSRVEEPVRNKIKTGVNTVADCAKKTITKAIEKVSDTMVNLGKRLAGSLRIA